LGGVDAGEIKAYLLPSPAGGDPFAPAVVVGTLGSDVFNQYDVELDLAHGPLNLFPPARCQGPLYARVDSARVPLDPATGGSTNPILIDGKEAKGDIGIATCCSQMGIHLAHDLFGLNASTPGVTAISRAAGTTAYSFSFGSLATGGVSMPNPRVALVDLGDTLHGMRAVNAFNTYCVSSHHMQLVLRELAHFHLYFAFEKGRLYVAPVVP
jgi:hypothetical protein